MEKLSLSQFRDIKIKLLDIVYEADSKNGEVDEETFNKYLSLQEELLSYDLSDIDFSEWKNMVLIQDTLDFSKTHANLDFSLIRSVEFEKINLDGCNIRNTEYLDYDEDSFTEEYKEKHPELIPDESIPKDIRDILKQRKIEFHHLIEYPSLRKYITRHSFSNGVGTPSKYFIRGVGFDNAMKLFDEYPRFIEMITKEYKETFTNTGFKFNHLEYKIQTAPYEEAKQALFKDIVSEIKGAFWIRELDVDVLPEEMKNLMPKLIISDDELPEDVSERFYSGTLTVSDFYNYGPILKEKDTEFGTRSSFDIRTINKICGSIWKYVEEIPPKYHNIVSQYIDMIKYGPTDILSEMEPREIITEAIAYNLSNSMRLHTLEDLKDYLEYLPPEEVFKSKIEYDFIQKCGFDNLIEFTKDNDRLLDFESFGSSTVLEVFSKYYYSIKDMEISNQEDLKKAFQIIIHQIREDALDSDDYYIRTRRDLFYDIAPQEFLDLDLVNRILETVPDKSLSAEDIERFFSGDIKSLIVTINKYPALLEAFKGKNVIINDSKANELAEKMGMDNFLSLGQEYGASLITILNSMTKEETNNLLSKDKVEIEKEIDKRLYKSIVNHRDFDIRTLPQKFKQAHPELYLPEDAPKDLQEAFYERKSWYGYTALEIGDLQDHPEWAPYLLDVDLKMCFSQKMIGVYGDVSSDSFQNRYDREMDFIEFLEQRLSQREILDILTKYGRLLNNRFFTLGNDLSREHTNDAIMYTVYSEIINRRINYNIDIMPQEFIDRNPELFLDKRAPQELQNAFYQKQITPEMIRDNLDWIPYLRAKDLYVCCSKDVTHFVENCQSLELSNDQIFEYFIKYGEYLSDNIIDIWMISRSNISDIDKVIKEQLLHYIIRERGKYDEGAKKIIGDLHPELFLDDDAPQELKDAFYVKTTSYPNSFPVMSFELLREHKEWLPFLENKNALLSFQKTIGSPNEVLKFFQRYGSAKEAIRIGMKQPTYVTQMIRSDKVDALCEWYDRVHFIPHHVVMINFPIEQIDKFVASGKKWSQIMKLERFTRDDETIEALLKASMCFGIFDNDSLGLNKMMKLFTDLPETITEEDFEKIRIMAGLKEQMGWRGQESIIDDLLAGKIYERDERGVYTLKIDQQHNKDLVKSIRDYLEELNISTILTPHKAHILFGGFDMEYDPEFRDFLLDNMETILTSDDYISSISAIQKQWKEIKAMNSNRHLTLDLAFAHIRTNSYQNVQPGNVRLAEVVHDRLYSQQDFEILQKIYNLGKIRTHSSIPRIEGQKEKYTYEIVRLDDPIALVIGPLTDCCQELGNAAQGSMEHSMTNKHGRLFIIRDEEGNFVAQSWVWRNKNVLCFDNIEIPSKAFTRARQKENDRLEYDVLEVYQQASQELIERDEKEYKKLLEQGKITEEEYEALKIAKVTVGKGYNDIAEALKNETKSDESKVARPIPSKSPVLHSSIYIRDSESQYILAGDQDVVDSSLETPTIYHDEYEILDNDKKPTQEDLMMLTKLEYATKSASYEGNFEVNPNLAIRQIGYNYFLDPNNTRIVMNPNFAIVYEEKEDEIVIGEILYNTSIKNGDEIIDITDEVAMQMKMALDQIGKEEKPFTLKRLSEKQQKMYDKAIMMDTEQVKERGLSHESK